jgi:hypothetical protein
MGPKQATPASFWRKIYLCLLLVFRPSKFTEEERTDIARLEAQPSITPERGAMLRQALFEALIWMVASASLGFLLGFFFGCYFGRSEFITSALQLIGAAILLWATLAVRGWDIASFATSTLTERVNQWIYRFSYSVGTALLVMTVGWVYCNG